MDAAYTVMDYWWGEDYGNVSVHPMYRQNPVVPGSWRIVGSTLAKGLRTRTEFWAGFAMGQGYAPETLPLTSGELGTPPGRIAASVDLIGMIGYGMYGVGQMRHADAFTLQQSDSDQYRLIIMTNYALNPGQSYYVTAGQNGGIKFSPVNLLSSRAP